MITIRKDNYYEICKTFKEWLAKNGHRFHLKFKIRHYPAKGKLNIYFENVAPEIFCTVNEWSCVEVGVHFKRRFWDYICDVECTVRRSEDGKYYCGFCEPPTYYKTPKELVIAHTFENFLEWVNEHFTLSHVLELKKGRGWTEARIIDAKGSSDISTRPSDNFDEGMTRIVPVIKRKGAYSLLGKER